MTFYVLGIPNKIPEFSKEQEALIANTKVFSGGERHYRLVKELLPETHEWISISGGMNAVYAAYKEQNTPIVVFASGNPLFYGISNTLQKKFPQAKIYSYPAFSAIQVLANATNTNSNELVTVSVHGRTWEALDKAIITQLPLIGVLTDGHKNPKTIAERLLYYGYDNYEITIGEDLGGSQECIQRMTLAEATTKEFYKLNCILLHKITHRHIPFGIPDQSFKGLDGRPNMITKLPIRLTTLHLLEIERTKVFWDIGFCTGAVSIEAKLRNPSLTVVAFEKRTVCEEIIETNQKRFGVPGITTLMGDFFTQEVEVLPMPDAVFIGGHGGKLEELLNKIDQLVASGTRMVINAVQEQSYRTFKKVSATLGWQLEEEMTMVLNMHNPIRLLKAIKP